MLQYCFCFTFCFFWPWGMWDVSSPVRGQTRAPCVGRPSHNPGPPGKSRFFPFLLWQTPLTLTNATERHSLLHTLRSAPWFYLRALFWSQHRDRLRIWRVNASGATLINDERLRVDNTAPLLSVSPRTPQQDWTPRILSPPFQPALPCQERSSVPQMRLWSHHGPPSEPTKMSTHLRSSWGSPTRSVGCCLNAFPLYSPGSVFSAQTNLHFSSPCFSLKLNYLPQF